MRARDRAELLSRKANALADLAGRADDAITRDMRKTVCKILESEFHDMESGASEGILNVIVNNALPLASVSSNPGIKSIGDDAQKNLQKKDDELDSLKTRLDAAMMKIDSLSAGQLVSALGQMQYGLEASLQYILTGKSVIKRIKLQD